MNDDPAAILDLATRAARSARWLIDDWNFNPADLMDMIQAAAEAILAHIDQNESYAFVCGRNAALSWWFGFHLEVPRQIMYRTLATARKGPPRRRISLDALEESGFQLAAALPANEPQHLSAERRMALFDILYRSRQKRGKRGLLAATRDVQIVDFIVAGYSNAAIAFEMATKAEHIKKYRQGIRKTLAGYLKMR